MILFLFLSWPSALTAQFLQTFDLRYFHMWSHSENQHQIYGCSNFGHKFCLLALLAKFMAKNLAQDHKWLIPVASLLPQDLTPTY